MPASALQALLPSPRNTPKIDPSDDLEELFVVGIRQPMYSSDMPSLTRWSLDEDKMRVLRMVLMVGVNGGIWSGP